MLLAALGFPRASSSLLTSQVSMSQLSAATMFLLTCTITKFSHVGKSKGAHSVMCQRIRGFGTWWDTGNHPGPMHAEICQGHSKCLLWCLSRLCRNLQALLASFQAQNSVSGAVWHQDKWERLVCWFCLTAGYPKCFIHHFAMQEIKDKVPSF